MNFRFVWALLATLFIVWDMATIPLESFASTGRTVYVLSVPKLAVCQALWALCIATLDGQAFNLCLLKES